MLGIETLTVNKFQETVQRMRDDLAETGEARVSLDDLGERVACKSAIKHATSDLKPKEYEKDFDGETNEFIVILVENEDAEVEETEPVAETESDHDEESTSEDDATEPNALPF